MFLYFDIVFLYLLFSNKKNIASRSVLFSIFSESFHMQYCIKHCLFWYCYPLPAVLLIQIILLVGVVIFSEKFSFPILSASINIKILSVGVFLPQKVFMCNIVLNTVCVPLYWYCYTLPAVPQYKEIFGRKVLFFGKFSFPRQKVGLTG